MNDNNWCKISYWPEYCSEIDRNRVIPSQLTFNPKTQAFDTETGKILNLIQTQTEKSLKKKN